MRVRAGAAEVVNLAEVVRAEGLVVVATEAVVEETLQTWCHPPC